MMIYGHNYQLHLLKKSYHGQNKIFKMKLIIPKSFVSNNKVLT